MPRPPRLVLPGVPMHLTQRGNNRTATFRAARDFERYLRLLAEARRRARCAIHAYVLMSNHVHILFTPHHATSPARMMHFLNSEYVRYFNARHGRTGTLWEGRCHTAVVDSDHYLFACHRYIELNPVRAGLVADPALYRWSSYRHNAYGTFNHLLIPHRLYTALDADPENRRAGYRAMFAHARDDQTRDTIRVATRRRTLLGDEAFRQRVLAGNPLARIPMTHGGDRRSFAIRSTAGQ